MTELQDKQLRFALALCTKARDAVRSTPPSSRERDNALCALCALLAAVSTLEEIVNPKPPEELGKLKPGRKLPPELEGLLRPKR